MILVCHRQNVAKERFHCDRKQQLSHYHHLFDWFAILGVVSVLFAITCWIGFGHQAIVIVVFKGCYVAQRILLAN